MQSRHELIDQRRTMTTDTINISIGRISAKGTFPCRATALASQTGHCVLLPYLAGSLVHAERMPQLLFADSTLRINLVAENEERDF